MSSIGKGLRTAAFGRRCSAMKTKRNFAVRKVKHEKKSIAITSELARHLAKHPTHTYTWNIACTEKTTFRSEIRDGLLIACEKPTLNKQVHCFIAKLFPSTQNLIRRHPSLSFGMFLSLLSSGDEIHTYS